MKRTMTIIILLSAALLFALSCNKEKTEPTHVEQKENVTQTIPEETMETTEEETPARDQCIGSWLVGDDNIRQFVDIPKKITYRIDAFCLVIHDDMTATIIVPTKEKKYTFNGKITKDSNNYILEIDGRRRFFAITDKHPATDETTLYLKFINTINDNFKDGSIADGKKWDLLCKEYGFDCSAEGCIEYVTGILDIYYPHDPPPADAQ